MDRLFSTGDLAHMAGAHLEPTNLLTLILLGSAIVLIAVGLSVFPTLRANPRDILARMEAKFVDRLDDKTCLEVEAGTGDKFAE